MAANPWTVYNEAKATLGLKLLNLSTDAFKMALFQSTSNCPNAALVNAWYATLTNEVANANGYLTGGVVLSSVSYAQVGGVAKFATGNGVWTASGGSIPARYAVLYDNTSSNKDLLCYTLLDNASPSVDVVSLNGEILTVQINAAGVFTLA